MRSGEGSCLKRIICLLLVTAVLMGCLTMMVSADDAVLKTTEQGIQFLKSQEGFSANKYWDYSQYSIGYGTACRGGDYPGGITVEQADAAKREYPDIGVLITNPPYGVRMLDIKQARLLAAAFGAATAGKKGLKKYIISADNEYERAYGPRADKKRKLYNGMIQCNLYMYYQQERGGHK